MDAPRPDIPVPKPPKSIERQFVEIVITVATALPTWYVFMLWHEGVRYEVFHGSLSQEATMGLALFGAMVIALLLFLQTKTRNTYAKQALRGAVVGALIAVYRLFRL